MYFRPTIIDILLDNIIFELQRAGGISRYWFELIKHCSKVDGVDLSYIEGPSALSNLFRRRLTLPPNKIACDKNIPLVLRRYLPTNRDQCDVFHSSYLRISRNAKHKQVTTVHDLIYEKFVTGTKRAVHVAQKKRSIRHADGLICVSENTKRDLLVHYPEMKIDDIVVIPNGVGPEFHPQEFSKDRIDINGIDLAPQSYVLFVGNRSRHKNFGLALDVIASDTARDLNLTLLAAGGDTFAPWETSDIEQRGIRDSVSHVSDISTEDLNVLYNNAFCLIYPSLYEGFGIPLLEAMSTGCPVLASNVASIPEVVGDGAILCDPSDAVAFVSQLERLTQKAERKSLLKAGASRAAQFSWDETCRKTIALYRSLL